MLYSPLWNFGGIRNPAGQGDILNTNEIPQSITLATAYTYTGPDLVQGEIFRSGQGGAITDIFCTANQLVDALRGNFNVMSPPGNALYGITPNQNVALAWPANVEPFNPNSSFRRIIVSTTANAITQSVPASSGISLAAAPFNTTIVAASSWREYIFSIVNSTPTYVLVGSQTTATKPFTANVANQVRNITPGMSAYGTNIAANTKVVSVNIDTGVVILDTNVTATLANNAVTFTPTVVVYGLRGGLM